MSSTSFKAEQQLEGLYNFLLLLASAAFLANLVGSLVLGGPLLEGVLFWPAVVALALIGGPLNSQPLVVSAVGLGLVVVTTIVTGAEHSHAVQQAVVCLVAVWATHFAGRGAEDLVKSEAERANFLAREVRRLEATRRKFMEKSAKVGLKRKGRKRGKKGVTEQRAVYQFHRTLLAGFLEARTLKAIASCYERALKEIGVKEGIVLAIGKGKVFRLATAWGVDDGEKAHRALLDVDGRSFLDWLADKRSILERRELDSHPMLEEARANFSMKYFPPQLIVPGSFKRRLVLAVLVGRQKDDAVVEMRPTLFSPLLAVQEEVLNLILV